MANKTNMEMKKELKNLREQVKEKTIVKYYHHPIYGQVALLILFGLFVWQLAITYGGMIRLLLESELNLERSNNLTIYERWKLK